MLSVIGAVMALIALATATADQVARTTRLVGPTVLASSPATPLARTPLVRITVDRSAAGRTVPRDFLGLSFEMSNLLELDTSGRIGSLTGFLRSLGPGVARLGGISSETAVAWSENAERPSWASESITPRFLSQIGALMSAVDWRVILSLNLNHYDPAAAASETRFARSAMGHRLETIAIGNEPDGYESPNEQFRHGPWGFPQYETQTLEYLHAIWALTPRMPVAGPDISTPDHTSWIRGEVHIPNVRLLTAHYYPLNCAQHPSIQLMLSPQVRRAETRVLALYANLARALHRPIRVDETNNVSCGGEPGVSDTYASALWAIDYLVRALQAGLAGINLHDTLSCTGYSPLCSPTTPGVAHHIHANPEWYALLLASQLSGDRLLPISVRSSSNSILAIALRTPQAQGPLQVLIVDERSPAAAPAAISITGLGPFSTASVLRLTGPSLAALSGVTLGGSAVADNGSWAPKRPLPVLHAHGGMLSVPSLPSSAMLLTLKRPRP